VYTSAARIFAVAPMMDWTDRHCRVLHRALSARALLYTEMVTALAVVHGDRERLIGFSPVEHPVALQLGGSDPAMLAKAARIGADFGYDEINLNVGCPSDRVRDGRFGACLMAEPALVADCIAAMKAAVGIPVTVKCRIGIDDQDPEPALDALADAVVAAGTDAIWVHARKAWLSGLSPKENRTVPPLDYGRVQRLKARLPGVFIGLNGGLDTLAAAKAELAHVDGVMLGRAAYHNPDLLAGVDAEIYGQGAARDVRAALDGYLAYVAENLARGAPLAPMVRPMIGLFSGRPGARLYRRILTVESVRRGAGLEVIEQALSALRPAPDAGDAAAVDPVDAAAVVEAAA
jgi:tRNA-dihydrouridine synthase A